MKNFPHLRSAILLVTVCCFRSSPPVLAQTASAMLDANNVGAPVYANVGFLWNNPAFNGRGLEVPRVTDPNQPRRSTVFSSGLWLGGLDNIGIVYTATETYRQGNPPLQGFWAGPMEARFSQSGDAPAYAYVWKVTRQQINAHRAAYTQPGYQPPAELTTWPARPAGYTGISVLAPFVDANGNGFYDPQGGDYPDVPGDQAIFWIANDAAGAKVPLTPPMGVEVQGLAYAFDLNACNPVVDNTIFVRYRLTNHSATTYQNTYVGHYVDFDLGYYEDDYVGSDSTRQMAYGYNGDDLDEGVTGYGTDPPVQGVVALDEPLTGFTYYQNDASQIGNPQAAADYYNYLRGNSLYGTPITYGGSGYSGNGRRTRWMYPGNPVTNTGWTEGHINDQGDANAPGDRRGLLTFGPFTFQPGQTKTVSLAYVFARAGGVGAAGNVGVLRTAVDRLRTCIAGGLLATRPDAPAAGAFTLRPNPAQHAAYLTLPAAPSTTLAGQLLDALGRVVRTFELRTTETTLDLHGLPPGLYTVRAGAVARRLVVAATE